MEDYLSTADGHEGRDYGYAISAAVRAQPLTTPSAVFICRGGDHPVFSQAIFDRPVYFEMAGSRLIPQTSLQSPPVTVRDAVVTSGSRDIKVQDTRGLAVDQAVGGTGIVSGSYITDVRADGITISLMPSLIINGYITAGDPTVKLSSSLAGVSVGQEVRGYGIQSGTKIISISYAEPQSVTLSLSPTQTINTSVALTISAGTWEVPALTAIKATPVLAWKWNRAALQNEFGQMIGGSMRDVWIVDKTERGITGLQGVQIYGWDGFNSYNTRVEQINGSGMVLGGYNIDSGIGGMGGSVRESFFFDTKIRYSGSAETSQPALAIFSPDKNEDEHNQLGFSGCQLVTNLSENLTIGTYDTRHHGMNGPRLIWFSNNCQIEGGSYLNAEGIPSVTAQFDSIHLEQADDVYFDGVELNSEGYGKAVVRIDRANLVAISNARIYLSAQQGKYVVSVTHGSKAVHLVRSDDRTPFLTGGTWNGIAAIVKDGGSCEKNSSCIVHLDAGAGVVDDKTLTLSSPYMGDTNAAAIFIMPTSGYMVNVVEQVNHLDVDKSQINPADAENLLAMGAHDPSQVAYTGQGLNPQGLQQATSDFKGAINFLPIVNTYDADYLPVFSAYMPNLRTGHFGQRFFGVEGSKNNSAVEQFGYTGGPGSEKNFISWGLYGNYNAFQFNGEGILQAPVVNAAGGFQFNGIPGFTGVKKIGNCSFTIKGGIITDVSGC